MGGELKKNSLLNELADIDVAQDNRDLSEDEMMIGPKNIKMRSPVGDKNPWFFG